MKILIGHIEIGRLKFDQVVSVEVESAWKLLTDTATIVLPAHLKINADELLKYVRYGDRVSVSVGYDGKVNRIFTGYVTELKPGVPVEIKCEDEMWKLKQQTVSGSFRRARLSDLIARFFGDYETDYNDMSIGNYYVQNLTKAKVLEKLKSDFGMYAFFRDGRLVIGKIYSPDATPKVFVLNENMISDDLVFKRKNEVRLKVKAISNMPDGSKVEIEIGDDDGEQRTLNFYDLSKTELKAAAERELERLKYDGWRGSFTAFGEPLVKHGEPVELRSKDEGTNEKTGRYFVDKVVYNFGKDGYRQKIYLGPRV